MGSFGDRRAQRPFGMDEKNQHAAPSTLAAARMTRASNQFPPMPTRIPVNSGPAADMRLPHRLVQPVTVAECEPPRSWQAAQTCTCTVPTAPRLRQRNTIMSVTLADSAPSTRNAAAAR